jgi:hypothetical protein
MDIPCSSDFGQTDGRETRARHQPRRRQLPTWSLLTCRQLPSLRLIGRRSTHRGTAEQHPHALPCHGTNRGAQRSKEPDGHPVSRSLTGHRSRCQTDAAVPSGSWRFSPRTRSESPDRWRWRLFAAVTSPRRRFPVVVSLGGCHLLGRGLVGALVTDSLEALAVELVEADAVGLVGD